MPKFVAVMRQKFRQQGIGNEKEFGFLPNGCAWITGFRR